MIGRASPFGLVAAAALATMQLGANGLYLPASALPIVASASTPAEPRIIVPTPAMMVFAGTRCARQATGGRPNQANEIAIYLRTGLFWQDTAGTVPAVATGDPVKRWDDASGNGYHKLWVAGPVPTLAAGGGVTFAGGQLESSLTTSGSTSWTLYQRAIDAVTSDTGWSWASGTSGTPTTGIAPSYSGAGAMAYGLGGTYNTGNVTDSGAVATRGLSVAGTAVTAFADALEFSSTGVATAVSGTRTGCAAGGFGLTGTVINEATYLGADGLTQRNTTRSFLVAA